MPSPLQDTLFLLMMEPERPEPLRRATAALPRALAEFFSIVGEIPLGQDGFPRTVWNEGNGEGPMIGEVNDDAWTVGLPGLLADYWAAEITPLSTFLDPTADVPPNPPAEPLNLLFTNETRDGHAYIEFDGSDDPPVHEFFTSSGWSSSPRPFSAWLFTLFADAYVAHAWAPLSFWGPAADLTRSAESAPLQLFKSGLWLRARAPLSDSARAALSATFLDHECRPFDDATLDQFVAPDAAIWVVGDHWWLWADTPPALTRIAEIARTKGGLETLVADTPEARAALG
ncbi:hypothetical protein [Nocardia sp. NPDC057668]|uniref:hypothetical protein n=1 Tax=Nocardia sp. NPDC057668 TaxID=3346202 RepID=UPI00366E24BD